MPNPLEKRLSALNVPSQASEMPHLGAIVGTSWRLLANAW